LNAAVSKRHESKLRKEGVGLIAGVDESGIGPLAGPVVAAAVLLKEDYRLKGLDDSKKLRAESREALFSQILGASISVSIGIVDNSTIDRVNILQASLQAMLHAVELLSVAPEHILVDGIRKIPGINIPQTAIKHGDRVSSAIAAASVIAKVVRDRIMKNYDVIYPHYCFCEHKGYGTEKHMKRIKKFGTCPIHRLSYQPVIKVLKSRGMIFI